MEFRLLEIGCRVKAAGDLNELAGGGEAAQVAIALQVINPLSTRLPRDLVAQPGWFFDRQPIL